jgi:hypothetical protein
VYYLIDKKRIFPIRKREYIQDDNENEDSDVKQERENVLCKTLNRQVKFESKIKFSKKHEVLSISV